MAAFNFEFWINKNLPGKCLDVMMHLKTPGGLPAVVQPVALTTITPEMEGTFQAPAFMLTSESAQSLMDELWSVGVRPSNGAGSVGELDATKRHLEDMRRIVDSLMEFKK